MADPATMDVEDVLSSIRRLVSEESKSTPPLRPRAAAAAVGARPVEDPADAPHTKDGSAEDALDAHAMATAKAVEAVAEEVAQDADADEDAAAAAEDGAEGAIGSATAGGMQAEKLMLTAALRVAVPEDKRLHKDADARPRVVADADDGTSAEPAGRRRGDRPRPVLLDDLVAEYASAVEREAQSGAEDAAADPVAEDPDFDAELETALGKVSSEEVIAELPEAETDLAEDDLAEDDLAEDDLAEDGGLLSAGGDREQDMAMFSDDQIDAAGGEMDVLDEDALRDMVAQIVREELMGELGDRITRNVRKLVRREINRALAGRQFE